MTIYISLPITGQDLEERKATAEAARQILQKNPDFFVVTPFDIGESVEAVDPGAGYSDYMKEDVAYIIDYADAVCFLVNPKLTESKGVQLEFHTAKIYGKKIMRLIGGKVYHYERKALD